MKRKLVIAMVVSVMMMGATASAYIDNGDGSVTLEYGESYGSIGAAFGINYYELGYYNRVNPDEVVVYPGDVIKIGCANAPDYYYGETTGIREEHYPAEEYEEYDQYEGYEEDGYCEPSYYDPDYYDAYGNSYLLTWQLWDVSNCW